MVGMLLQHTTPTTTNNNPVGMIINAGNHNLGPRQAAQLRRPEATRHRNTAPLEADLTNLPHRATQQLIRINPLLANRPVYRLWHITIAASGQQRQQQITIDRGVYANALYVPQTETYPNARCFVSLSVSHLSLCLFEIACCWHPMSKSSSTLRPFPAAARERRGPPGAD